MKITIIEIWALHPEIFKKLEQVELEKRTPFMEDIARTYLLGCFLGYPSIQSWNAEGLSNERFSWILGQRVYERDPTLSDKTGYSDRFDQPQWLHDVGMTRQEIVRARSVFGEQFVPAPLDLDNGKNLSTYGIDPSIFHEFRVFVDKLHPEIKELYRSAYKS